MLDTFEQTLDLAGEGNRQEALLGCDFVLRMDPQFEPARLLQERLRATAGAGRQRDDLARARMSPAAPTPPDDLFADLDGLGLDLPDLPARRSRRGLRAELAGACSTSAASRSCWPRRARAGRGDRPIRSCAASSRTAQERMEAEPYVASSWHGARQALAGGPGRTRSAGCSTRRAPSTPAIPGSPSWRRAGRRRRPRRRPSAAAPASTLPHPLAARRPCPRPVLAVGGAATRRATAASAAARRGAARLRRRRPPGRDRRLVAHLPHRHRPPGGVAPHRAGAQAEGRDRAPGGGDLPRRRRPARGRRRGAARGRRSSGSLEIQPGYFAAREYLEQLDSGNMPTSPRPAESRADGLAEPPASLLRAAISDEPGNLKEEILVPPEPGERAGSRAERRPARRRPGRSATAAAPAASSWWWEGPCCCWCWPAPGSSAEPRPVLPQLGAGGDGPLSPAGTGPDRPRRAAPQGRQDRHRR